MAKLEMLWLNRDPFACGTRVTDAGLERLQGLTNLRGLELSGTQVTDEGVKKLQEETLIDLLS